MKIGAETIKKLEQMTKLNLTQEERDATEGYLSHWIMEFDKMESVSTSDTTPMVSVAELKNVFREDVAFQIVTRDKLFENAVEENNGYFQVPRTID